MPFLSAEKVQPIGKKNLVGLFLYNIIYYFDKVLNINFLTYKPSFEGSNDP